MDVNVTLHQINLTDINKTFHSKTAKYTSFSSSHGIFSRVDCILDHKPSINKFKRTEVISYIFYGHNGMKLEIN